MNNGIITVLQDSYGKLENQLKSATQLLKYTIDLMETHSSEEDHTSISRINSTDLHIVKGGGLRLREKPSTKSNIIKRLEQGTIVKFVKRHQDWAFVEVMGHGTDNLLRGWVFTTYILPIHKNK